MKLVLYSGGPKSENRVLHDALVGLIGRKRRRAMTYVPFSRHGASMYFERFKRRYKRHGVTEFHMLELDAPDWKAKAKVALQSDAIYLAGGNTFQFLHLLQETEMLPRLRRYARSGGVLAGLSAGAIIMTPHIGLAGYPPFCRDQNAVGLTDLEALGLVDFEFFPHHSHSARLRAALESYARRGRYPVIGTWDGGGVVVDGKSLEFFGRSELYLCGLHGPIRGF